TAADPKGRPMRLRFAYPAFLFFRSLCFAPLARAQQDPAEAANPPQNPAPTGRAIPPDVKGTPAPHKPCDYTLYGRVNVSLDVGTQDLTSAPCITAASPCAPPQGNLRWLPDVASNLSRLGVRGYYDLSGRDLQTLFQLDATVEVAATPDSTPIRRNDTCKP